MKHTIKTDAGSFIIEPTPFYQGKVKIILKPAIFPEMVLTIKPEDAGLIAQALGLVAGEVQELAGVAS